MRTAEIVRTTTETDIRLSVNLDGSGEFAGTSGVGFLDHMLHQTARHGRFDLTYTCAGDLHIDTHHTVEDLGICLGDAVRDALGDKVGIRRYGVAYVPMDEALARVVIDLSGRPCLRFAATFPAERVGTLETETVAELFGAVATRAGMALHVDVLAGTNTHHIIEAIFKAFGRALRDAVTVEGDALPTTKGLLT